MHHIVSIVEDNKACDISQLTKFAMVSLRFVTYVSSSNFLHYFIKNSQRFITEVENEYKYNIILIHKTHIAVRYDCH